LDRTERVVVEAAGALEPGALLVQMRDKAASLDDLGRSAARMRDVTARAGALFVVNAMTAELVDLAARVAADGVHVPCREGALAAARARLGPAAWVTTPAHDDDDVKTAAGAAATGILVSPIFASPGKGLPRGVEALRAARALDSTLAIYALGGVDETNAAACAGARADGVAVIRALYEAVDVAATTRALGRPFRS
jgi:thiamine-phosphate pyrophosphorylase